MLLIFFVFSFTSISNYHTLFAQINQQSYLIRFLESELCTSTSTAVRTSEILNTGKIAKFANGRLVQVYHAILMRFIIPHFLF